MFPPIPTPSVPFVPVAPSSVPVDTAPVETPAVECGTAPLSSLPPPKAPANDAERARSAHAEYGKILTDPRLRAFLGRKLGATQLAIADQEDLLASVLETLWRRRADRHAAQTLPRMLGLSLKILHGKLVDFYRHQDVVALIIRDAPRVHQEDSPSRHEPADQPTYVEQLRPPRSLQSDEAVEMRERMAYVNGTGAKVGLTDDDVEVMFAMTWDERATWDELADERGETAGALRQRIRRLQEKMQAGWSRRLAPKLLLTLLLLAMLVLFALAALGPARRPPPPPTPLPAPTAHEVTPVAPTAHAPETPPARPQLGAKPR
jgi:hypothetical protein